MKKSVFQAVIIAVLAVLSIMGAMPAIAVEGTKISEKAADVVPVIFEPRLLLRTFIGVGRDRVRWVESICATVAGLSAADYARFVRLVYEESVKTEPSHHFTQYTTNENRLRAYQCLEQGGENASPETQLQLYWIIESSRQRAPTNRYKWLKRAADGGHSMAQYLMAEAIAHFGVPTGRPPADTPPEILKENTAERYRYWLIKSAEGGVPRAQYELARLYLGISRLEWASGLGVDIPKGLSWLERAAKQSEDPLYRDYAAARLGELYFTGEKIPQDYDQAIRWFKVVDEKHMTSCGPLVWVRQILIRMYRDGLGVEKNMGKVKEYTKTPTACI